MRIFEVPGGKKAVITVKGPGERVDLSTKTIGSYKDMLLLDIIRMGGKMISFKTERIDLEAEISVVIDGRPIVWKEVEIERIYYDKKFCYCARTKKSSEAKERRRARRIPLIDDGFIQLDGSRATPKVFVKDVSRTGVGIVIDKYVDINIGDRLFLSFYDENRVGNTKLVRKEKYGFHCQVRRMEEIGRDRNILGLSIAKVEQPLAGRLVLQKMA